MAMRLLVSICCIVTSSATGVWSESQFKTKYDAYVVNMDSAAVKTANANIVGEAIPAVALTDEIQMHRWYHDVNAAVQADAKATMNKALTDKSKSPTPRYPTADCLALIKIAMPWSTSWPADNKIYLNIVGDDPADAGNNKKAQDCLNALSGPEKELAIKVGMRSHLFDLFDTAWKDAVGALVTKDVAGVSGIVTGTLAAAVPQPPKKATGEETQPMYSSADATLRGEMMHKMVNQLNGQLPAV